MTMKQLRGALGLAALLACLAPLGAQAQVPEPLYQELVRIGQIVDPTCTAMAMRSLMPTADYNTWWAPGAAAPDASKAKLYPGVNITRDEKFGAHDKDLLDIFTTDRNGARNLPVFMWVPGGGGNKIEQQVRQANAFYDNIGRWGVKNGFVVVTVQRHQGQAWDDGGRDIATAVDWVKANISRYGGNGNNIVMGAHSAGTGPTGVYVGHPQRWPNGVQIKGMIYMSGGAYAGNYPGAPAPAAPGAGGGGGRGNGPAPGSACGSTSAQNGTDGAISGPSGATPAAPRAGGPGAPGAGGARGGGRGGVQLTDAERAERDNWTGFSKTPVRLMFVRAELDPGVMGDMTAGDKGMHDALCATEGPRAKDGEGRCPAMLYAKRHSHMSEVFTFDSPDTTVSKPILDFAKNALK